MSTEIKFHEMRKVAVLGSGVMGSAIALHLAQTGSEVLLLDLPAKEGPINSPAEGSLKAALKSKPSPVYSKRFANRITCGNFDDDLHKISEYDWIIEVVIERLDIKQQLFERLKHTASLNLITSNTLDSYLATMRRTKRRFPEALAELTFQPPRYNS